MIVGLLVALWSASGYVGAFIRASNVIYETPEGRPFWKLRPLQMLVTLAMILLMAIVALGLVLTGPIVEAVAEPIGVSSTATTVWDIAKWPVLALLFVTMVSLLYYASPNVKIRGFRWVTPGSVVALVAWVVASAAFALFVANFGSYNKTYGTLAGRCRAADVAVDHQPGDPLRPPAERRARAQPRDRGGHAPGPSARSSSSRAQSPPNSART